MAAEPQGTGRLPSSRTPMSTQDHTRRRSSRTWGRLSCPLRTTFWAGTTRLVGRIYSVAPKSYERERRKVVQQITYFAGAAALLGLNLGVAGSRPVLSGAGCTCSPHGNRPAVLRAPPKESPRTAGGRTSSQSMYTSSQMTTALRAMTSIGLCVWMSALACLAGCGQILASARLSSDADSAIALAEMPSCHQSHSSPPSPQKKQDSVSCCLPDAISQKTAADLTINVTYALISGAAADIEAQPHPPSENPLQVRLHRGRQTILQTHLLRI